MTRPLALVALAAFVLLAGCKEELAQAPAAVPLTTEATGHFCQMNLLEHPGPKAQVHLAGLPDPLFFSQVRDAVAYQRMPEQSHAIAAIYVNDMAAAPSWENPGAANWIAAETALYVVGARTPGGMGAPELIPFSNRTTAEAWAAEHGGQVLALGDIPDTEVLAPVEFSTDAEGNFLPPAAPLSQ